MENQLNKVVSHDHSNRPLGGFFLHVSEVMNMLKLVATSLSTTLCDDICMGFH